MVVTVVTVLVALPIGLPAAAAVPAWAPDRAAAELVAADPQLPVPIVVRDGEPAVPVPYGRFTAATCAMASQRAPLFRCAATYQAGPSRTTSVVVWVRIRDRDGGSVCASLRRPVPAGCWATADGERDSAADAQTAFRQWRGRQDGRPVMDQAGTSCVGYGSGYWRCVDMPVNGEPARPVRAIVVALAGGRTTITPAKG